ncbi:MAG TPA: hypothetical protein VHB70_07625 [Parafilimonas sp.]|nr:hypothetical protein [Parafilimonas sp.]
MEEVETGDLVKHKTITWMNNEKPFHVIKIENGKAHCEYIGRNGVQYFHDFDVEQLVVIEKATGVVGDRHAHSDKK